MRIKYSIIALFLMGPLLVSSLQSQSERSVNDSSAAHAQHVAQVPLTVPESKSEQSSTSHHHGGVGSLPVAVDAQRRRS